jgi:hypothetical protein
MRHFFFLTSILVIASCDNNSAEGTNLGPATISEQTMENACDCDTLEIDSLGNHTLKGKAFTGSCVSHYNGTEDKYLEKNILNGLLHGKVTYFDRSGELLLEEFYENGEQKHTGESETGLTCDCSDLEIQDMQGMSIYKLNGTPFTGRCEKFYQNSTQLYMESNYRKGILDGYTIYYNRDGSTILMENYEAGVMTSTVH